MIFNFVIAKKKTSRWGLFLLALIIFAPKVCQAQTRPRGNAATPRSEVKIEWLFDIKDDENDYPGGKIYLLVGKRKVLVFPEANEYYSIIEHKDFKRNKIPAAAVTAIFGWYAGQGKTLYVIRRANSLIVYIKYFDEGAPDFPVERLKTIRLPQ